MTSVLPTLFQLSAFIQHRRPSVEAKVLSRKITAIQFNPHFFLFPSDIMANAAVSYVPFPAACTLDTEHLSPHPDSQSQKFSCTSPPKGNIAGFITYIPGKPTVNLLPADVHAHPSNLLETRVLGDLYDRLWLVAKKSDHSIDALHV